MECVVKMLKNNHYLGCRFRVWQVRSNLTFDLCFANIYLGEKRLQLNRKLVSQQMYAKRLLNAKNLRL